MPQTPSRPEKGKTPSKTGLRSNQKQKAQLDRFIPARSGMNFDPATFSFLKENDQAQTADELLSPSKNAEYKNRLAEGLQLAENSSRILAFKKKAPPPPAGHENHIMGLYTNNHGPRPAKKSSRTLPTAPERVLDAPDLVDDYYLNLLDWGSNNSVAIALEAGVYLWNASSGGISTLMQCQEEDEYVTSVSWAADGKHIAVGTSSSIVQIWDADRCKQIRALKGHSARISSLSWNKTTLSSGGKDSLIIHHDVRVREHITAQLRGHALEVCGLKWSPNGQHLASGGNDNRLVVWELGGREPVHTLLGHQAAVKALAWCPFQSNLLASGGGTADRCIKFWNMHTGSLLNSVDTGSQVCALEWNRHEREILSSHGFSQNQLSLWKYPSMAKVGELTGHTARALHMSQSPDGTTVCTAAPDETLRFWNVFAEPAVATKKATSGGKSVLSSITLR
ncbi:hypothetical protein WJX74_002821 [Apatococcus lobatus]|uniref:CDC20/Fizzy WD40 domain-containing protein n=1 Tax=Apatococcus lobatus TaxID=904363 RepID=A0AAW1S6D9_9CHLO